MVSAWTRISFMKGRSLTTLITSHDLTLALLPPSLKNDLGSTIKVSDTENTPKVVSSPNIFGNSKIVINNFPYNGKF